MVVSFCRLNGWPFTRGRSEGRVGERRGPSEPRISTATVTAPQYAHAVPLTGVLPQPLLRGAPRHHPVSVPVCVPPRAPPPLSAHGVQLPVMNGGRPTATRTPLLGLSLLLAPAPAKRKRVPHVSPFSSPLRGAALQPATHSPTRPGPTARWVGVRRWLSRQMERSPRRAGPPVSPPSPTSAPGPAMACVGATAIFAALLFSVCLAGPGCTPDWN